MVTLVCREQPREQKQSSGILAVHGTQAAGRPQRAVELELDLGLEQGCQWKLQPDPSPQP